jgi:hypothetical protein
MARTFSRVFAQMVLLPESFRGGCSFGAAPLMAQALPICGAKSSKASAPEREYCEAKSKMHSDEWQAPRVVLRHDWQVSWSYRFTRPDLTSMQR